MWQGIELRLQSHHSKRAAATLPDDMCPGFDLCQCVRPGIGTACFQACIQQRLDGSANMTQHLLPEHTLEARRTKRRLAVVIVGFLAFTAAMAVAVGVAVG